MKLKMFFQAVLATGFIFGQFPAWSLSACKDVISKQEVQKGIPQDLLKAIATVESGISPWAINAKGRAHIFRSKEAAAHYVRELVEEGIGNFSVGCMQLHYASHRRYFKSVEAMLDPENNIAHAAMLIKKLERRHGSLERAVKLYHSPSSTHHNRYQKQVYGLWGKFRGSYKPKDAALRAVALKKPIPQKPSAKMSKRSSKIKFGMGGTSFQKNKREKI